MPIDRVVVNASPLICLAKSGLVELLPALFSEIAVPEAVCREISAKGKIDLSSSKLLSYGWLHQVADIIDFQVASWDLGAGESAVLGFAIHNREYRAVIDDLEARRCALTLGCRFTGTVGILVLAKRKKILASVRQGMSQLRNAGLWLSDSFVEDICRTSGE